MLLPRVLTALVLLPLLLAALFGLQGAALYAVFAMIGSIAAWEWAALMGWQRQSARVGYAVAIAAVFAGIWFSGRQAEYALGLSAVAVLWWWIALVLVRRYPQSFSKGTWPAARMAPLGLLLIASTILALTQLHNAANGGWRVLFVLFIVFAADVGAYLVGKNFGKRKLAPAVSPGKSIEGAIGGFVLAALWVLASAPFVFPVQSLSEVASLSALGGVTALASVIGDLTESMFKRIVGIKDSSNLLPGHGGVLDRIDAILAAAPVFYLGAYVLKL